jgi:HD-like signal output (HDOD) protein
MSEEKGLLEIVNEFLRSGKVELPAYDLTCQRIRQEIGKNDPNIKDIEKMIISDQALTAQVLRVANSAFYSGLKKISTVRDAMIRLGTNEIANIVTIISQGKNYQAKDPFVAGLMEKLWQHSVACAAGAQWLAQLANLRNLLNEAFLAGLLHDVGKLFLLTVIENLKVSGKLNFPLNEDLVNQTLTDLHTESGHSLLKNWNLPEIYSGVVRDHHADKFDANDDLLVIVRLVDQACLKNGLGLRHDPSIVLAAVPEAGTLGLSEVTIAELEIKLEDSLDLANYR